MSLSIYDSLGGFTEVRKIIVEFYNKVLDDDTLSPIFKDVNMSRVIDHQTRFISMLLGGPESYTDEEIRAIHMRLGLDNRAFDSTKSHLSDTLFYYKLSNEHVDFVLGQFEKRRGLIVHN